MSQGTIGAPRLFDLGAFDVPDFGPSYEWLAPTPLGPPEIHFDMSGYVDQFRQGYLSSNQLRFVIGKYAQRTIMDSLCRGVGVL